MSRVAVTAVLLLAFAAQAAAAVHDFACPMMDMAATADEGCEHCPPPPPEVALHAALPECCVVHAAPLEASVSEPVRAPHPASSVALAPPRVLAAPVAVPLARAPLPVSHAPAPPPPSRNLPLLS
ncbi:MAG: hypothetical protein EHM78_22035 [Myxococcaceae bacterium]|nr:MAG: hypothetical protein EHM78_22035 [Myxococcaceae bacterium]